ncbi:hypothetical protein GS597_06355 [Synechococcales cyanobacterium C]|uniref:Uncharacterized protein n=1 Tax=Petrachloros mirabilis ULC683 TaxID=2781853 RepID=A0A8K2A7F3_9CYAN|nr:DUF1190 domain-containing protein [Petrachloros mirabilis]NCJ06144.1 hypothetical protein [Petrachloros mirabilis ULC683]
MNNKKEFSNSSEILENHINNFQEEKRKLWRKSAKVSLIFLATISITACTQYENDQTRIYRSQQDCIEDWQDPSLCKPYKKDSRTSNDYYQSPRYRIHEGTMYVRDGNDRYAPAGAGVKRTLSGNSRSIGNVNVKTPVPRGGFGKGASVRSSGS